MKHYISAAALCPFYKDENTAKVRCQWITEGATANITFDTRKNAYEYKCRYCRSDFEKCKIYEANKDTEK